MTADTTVGPLRHLLRVTGPIVAGSLVTVLLSSNDTVLLGRFGADVVAAAGVAVSIHMVCAVLIAGLAVAAQIHTARHTGAGEPQAAASAAAVTAAMTVAGGLLLMTMLLVFAAPLTGWIVDDDALTDRAVPYLRILALGLPFLGLGAALRGFAAGTGRTAVVFFASACAAAVDVGLAIALVAAGGSPLSVAAATVVAGVVSTAVLLLWRARLARSGEPVPRPADALGGRAQMRALWQTGWPEAVQLGLGTVSMVIVVVLIAPYGAANLAAVRVLDVVVGAVSTVLYGCGTAVTVLAGQRHGADDRTGMRAVEVAGRRLVAAVAGVAMLAGSVATPAVLRLAVDDPAVAAAVTAPVIVLAWAQVAFMAAIAVTNGVVRSTGDTRTGLYASLLAEYVLFLPLGIVLCLVLTAGLTGLYAAHLIYWAAYLAVVAHRRLRMR